MLTDRPKLYLGLELNPDFAMISSCTETSGEPETISRINAARKEFIETKDKTAWWQMIQLLPSSYNQMRTWDGNYETLMSMYFQRRNHKLDEWHTFCDWILELPYMKEFIGALDEKVLDAKEEVSEHMIDNLILNNQI